MEVTCMILMFLIRSYISFENLYVIPIRTTDWFLFGFFKSMKLSILIGNDHEIKCRGS